MSEMKYLSYDYEMPGSPDGFWHVYSLDTTSVVFDEQTLFYIKGPETPELETKVKKAAQAIDDAIVLAERLQSELEKSRSA